MALTEKQKKSIREWDRENMRTLSCRVRTDEAEFFKEYCTAHKTTPGKLLKKYVFDCMEKYSKELEEQEKKEKSKG